MENVDSIHFKTAKVFIVEVAAVIRVLLELCT